MSDGVAWQPIDTMAVASRLGFLLSLLAVASAFIPAPISGRSARLDATRLMAVKEVKSPAEFDGVSESDTALYRESLVGGYLRQVGFVF